MVRKFKHIFSVFKQYHTCFHILFHPTCIFQKIENCFKHTYQTKLKQWECHFLFSQTLSLDQNDDVQWKDQGPNSKTESDPKSPSLSKKKERNSRGFKLNTQISTSYSLSLSLCETLIPYNFVCHISLLWFHELSFSFLYMYYSAV